MNGNIDILEMALRRLLIQTSFLLGLKPSAIDGNCEQNGRKCVCVSGKVVLC